VHRERLPARGVTVPEGAHPLPSLAAALDLLHAIAAAKQAGATWAQIGARYGLSGRETKRLAHRLEDKAGPAAWVRANTTREVVLQVPACRL
jgi:hypothetical protein